MHTGSIDKNDLTFWSGCHPLNPEAGSLRLIRDRSNLFTDKSIKQRRLSGVRSAYQSDKAASIDERLSGLGHQSCLAFSAKICTRFINVSVVFSRPRRELNSSFP